MTFDSLGLRPETLHTIADLGYQEPTPVQTKAIPAVLSGRDMLAGAQTGTGKTAAFALPILDLLRANRPHGKPRVRGLVVVPTRELALQVEQSFRTYGGRQQLRTTAIFGGMRMDRQVKRLRQGVDLVVATPGRLLDHVRQHTIDLRDVEILVLDEADRMLDMGFIHDIRKILQELPRERQSLLFSATFAPPIRKLATELLNDPISIDVAPRNTTATPIRQVVHPVDRSRKRQLLTELIRRDEDGQVLVFTRTKRGANRLSEQIEHDGIRSAAIHGNKSQSQRVRALTSFKQGRLQVLVATDVAARGIDIDALPYVVNYDVPNVPEDYVHRIGRTGRAGLEGTAVTLASADEGKLVRAIEKLQGKPIEREVIEGYEPSGGISGKGGNGGDRMPARPGRKAPTAARRQRTGARPEQRNASDGTQGRHGSASGPSKGKRRQHGERHVEMATIGRGPKPKRRRSRGGSPRAQNGAGQSASSSNGIGGSMPGERLSGHRSRNRGAARASG